ncbi:MAG: hypothetical protein KAW12_09735 [Candidatus Aminicenantes bacterium]|nr:hypothetical protein [Candidatus Aminicenantes bacterium]
MSYWVRTQDKKNLVQLERILLNGKKVKGYSQMHPLGITLGSYGSEDRAAGVVDAMQGKIGSAAGLHIFFEMPREM